MTDPATDICNHASIRLFVKDADHLLATAICSLSAQLEKAERDRDEARRDIEFLKTSLKTSHELLHDSHSSLDAKKGLRTWNDADWQARILAAESERDASHKDICDLVIERDALKSRAIAAEAALAAAEKEADEQCAARVEVMKLYQAERERADAAVAAGREAMNALAYIKRETSAVFSPTAANNLIARVYDFTNNAIEKYNAIRARKDKLK